MSPSKAEFQGGENGAATVAAAEVEDNEARGRRRWCVVMLIIKLSIKKTTQCYQEEDQLQSSISTEPLINHQIQPDSTQQEEDEDTHVREEAQNEEQRHPLRNSVLQIVKERDRTSLDSLGGVQKVASIFGSHLDRGIQEPEGRENDAASPAGLVSEGNEAVRRWRRGGTVLWFIRFCIKKTTHCYQEEDQLQSSTSTVPLINPQIQAQNEEQGHQLRNRVVQIVKQRDRTSLDSLGGVQEIAAIFGSHLDWGIQEPEVRSSYRDNPIHTKHFFVFLFAACNNYTIFLLLVSAGLSFGTKIIEEGPKHGWHDGVVILAAVSMLITFPSLANFRRERKLEKERNKMKVRVVRREVLDITISNLVEGDIVCLQKGDLVPADGLLVSGDGLVLDGVSNSKIDIEENPFLFFGPKVKEGRGSMLATSVGAKTKLGELLSSGTQDPSEKTLLEVQIEKTNTFVENLSISVSILIAFVAFMRLLFRRDDGVDNEFPELKGNVSVDMLMKMFEKILLKPQGKVSILASALTVVVIAIQHGMPFVITISLSCWNSKVVKNQAEPQNLSACATMGIVTVICIDATGGVVCNDLEVSQFWIGEKDLENDTDSEIDPAVTKALEQVMLGISESFLQPAISASPLFVSLISWATSRWGMNKECVAHKYRKSSTKKSCSGILMKNDGDDDDIMYVNWSGAALTILNMCSHYYDSDGRSSAIEEDMKNKFESKIKAMEGSGLRPMAFACGQTEVEEIKENGLYLLALAGLKYPCTEEIKMTVKALRNAGVCIKLVSEDELPAVRAAACELGIISPESDELALDWEQIQDLELPERMEIMKQMTVMGSISAEDKLWYVNSLQQNGDVVAFFGGSSISNTPALKKADIGITEDTPCTMASESSDIIIKAKSSLYTSLKFGRCAIHNMNKFHQLQLTVCISGLLITLVTTMSFEESSITAVQLIWVNWIACILGGLMMVMELQVEELISSRPAKRTQSLLTKVMWKNIALEVVSQASVMLIFQFKGQVIPGMNKDIQKVMIFSSFSLSQVINLFHLMKLAKEEVLLSVVRKKWFLLGSVSVIVMQVAAAEYLKILGDGVRLNWVQWVVCFLLAALPRGIHVALEFISYSLLSRSDGLPTTVHPRRQTRPYLLRIAIPFSVFVFFFGISYHYNSYSGQTLR